MSARKDIKNRIFNDIYVLEFDRTRIEFLKLEKEDFLVQFVNHPKILDLSKEDKDTINSILNKY